MSAAYDVASAPDTRSTGHTQPRPLSESRLSATRQSQWPTTSARAPRGEGLIETPLIVPFITSGSMPRHPSDTPLPAEPAQTPSFTDATHLATPDIITTKF